MTKNKSSDAKIQKMRNGVIDPSLGITKAELQDEKIICFYVPMSWPFTYTKFFKSFLAMTHPVRMAPLKRLYGVTGYFTMVYQRFPLCLNRNEAVMKMLEANVWKAMFIDGDMEHPPDILQTLLAHDKDIAGGMYWHAQPPHLPVAYFKDKDSGPHVYKHLIDHPKDKLFEVDLTGMGCLLVDMKVFKVIDMPYFDYQSVSENGLKTVTEDVIFCEKAKEAGFKIWVDPMVKCRHIKIDSIGEEHFDTYMEAYKTGNELLKEFGIDGEQR